MAKVDSEAGSTAGSTAGSSIVDLINFASNGALREDLDRALTDLVAQMVRSATSGKAKGEINIKLKLSYDRAVMEIDGQYKVTTPSPVRARTMLFPDAQGALHRQNQSQLDMLPAATGMATGEVRTVPVEQRETRAPLDFRQRAANDDSSVR